MTKKRQAILTKELGRLFNAIPYYDMQHICKAASARHLQTLPPSIAIWLSAIAYIRHEYTDYTDLLDQGIEQDAARFFTRDQINHQLQIWQSTRLLSS